MTDQQEYMFANATDEENRLLAQSRVLDPLTRRFLATTRLSPGMRVLDLGSGAGNVALIAAEIVGDEGSVVGVDHDPDAVGRAQRLVGNLGFTSIEFMEGDLYSLDGIEAGFDAVVGRAVLMHLADPAAAIRQAVRLVRPGGLVCMHEPDMTYDAASPQTPLWQQMQAWILAVLEQVGVDARMGLSLHQLFLSAGLPAPRLTLEAHLGAGADSPAFGWANIVGSVVPLLERFGIATADEVGIDTLTERLDAEIDAHDGFALSPPMIGAWSVLPHE